MSNEKKKKLSIRTKYLIVCLVLGAILYKYAKPVDILFIIFAIFYIVALIVIVSIVIAILKYISNKISGKRDKRKDSLYRTESKKESIESTTMHEKVSQDVHDERAIKCTHPIGKEKYFDQLDNYLANGLIDKNEYRVLKERYDKLNIPENMH